MTSSALSSYAPLQESLSSTSLWVGTLSLENFRCYENLSIEVDARPVVLTGENGAGKTNILEALSFLSSGRGLRSSKLSQVSNLKNIEKGWTVFSKVHTKEGVQNIGTGLTKESGERRLIKVNQTPMSQSELSKLLTIFWVTPQIDQLLNESMSSRRRFFDKLVSSFFPEHSQHLYRYEYAFRERSRLLKEGGIDPSWLSILEQKMAQESMALNSLRQLFLSEINPLAQAAVSGFPKTKIELEGGVESLCSDMPALTVEEKIQDILKENRGEDARFGGSQIGAHQTQVQFIHLDQKIVSEFCSTGEQKALLLSLVLANCRLHKERKEKTPLLLLDEVVAHLDKRRRQSLCEEILSLGTQCWMTGTEESSFLPFGGNVQHFCVRDRTVIRKK